MQYKGDWSPWRCTVGIARSAVRLHLSPTRNRWANSTITQSRLSLGALPFVLVQREMESWRAPLASIVPIAPGQFAPGTLRGRPTEAAGSVEPQPDRMLRLGTDRIVQTLVVALEESV